MSRLGRLKETRTERWLREGRGRGECWGHGAGERGGSGPWSEPSSLPAVSGRPRGTAGPPCGWPGARADCPPGPQGIPRAPSPDEECFFDLLSKFQSSRMDDQRCPLEDGQPAAAEATATPALEGRVGESAPTPLQAPRVGRASCKVPPVTGSPGLQSSVTCHPPVPRDTPGRAGNRRGRLGSLHSPLPVGVPAGLTESSRGLGSAEALLGAPGRGPCLPGLTSGALQPSPR